MRVVDLIRAVRDGASVPPAAIKDMVAGVVAGAVPDYQSAAFLMAVFHRGLSDELTVALTEAMRDSGRVVRHPRVAGRKVDKLAEARDSRCLGVAARMIPQAPENDSVHLVSEAREAAKLVKNAIAPFPEEFVRRFRQFVLVRA